MFYGKKSKAKDCLEKERERETANANDTIYQDSGNGSGDGYIAGYTVLTAKLQHQVLNSQKKS